MDITGSDSSLDVLDVCIGMDVEEYDGAEEWSSSEDEEFTQFKKEIIITVMTICAASGPQYTAEYIERPRIPDERFSFNKSPLPPKFLFRFTEREIKKTV